MTKWIGALAVILSFCTLSPAWAAGGSDAQVESLQRDVSALEAQVSSLKQKVQVLEADASSRVPDEDTLFMALFFFAVFCGWWAQHSGRNPWLWFFAGMLFNVITALVLLSKNSTDMVMREGNKGVG